VLQEQEFQRVGSSETIRVDVRVIAASNVDFEEAIRQRRFREDLYYRLNVVPLHLPPLRDRREDILLLIQHFLVKISAAEGASPKRISEEALQSLQSRDWPGNVRELEHAIQMAFALSGDRQVLSVDDFRLRRPSRSEQPSLPCRPFLTLPAEGIDFDQVVSQFELSLLEQALTVAGGNKARAASLLRIKRTTLLAKMKTFEERSSRIETESPQIVYETNPNRTALVCEEVDPVRQLISKTLKAEGYRILEADTPGTALELFDCWTRDISLIVANSPSLCGSHDLVSRIRLRCPDLPALVLCDGPAQGLNRHGPTTQIVVRPFRGQDLTLALQELQSISRTATALCA